MIMWWKPPTPETHYLNSNDKIPSLIKGLSLILTKLSLNRSLGEMEEEMHSKKGIINLKVNAEEKTSTPRKTQIRNKKSPRKTSGRTVKVKRSQGSKKNKLESVQEKMLK